MTIRTTDLIGLPRGDLSPAAWRKDPRQLLLALPCPVHPAVALTLDPPGLCALCAREERRRSYAKARETGLSGQVARGELKR